MAVNTTDGSTVWEFAFALSLLEAGVPVEQANEAYAFANCENCLTGAVAFQVLLIVEQVDQIIPANLALALNYDCAGCITYAFAPDRRIDHSGADAEIQRELDLAMQRLQDLAANAGSLSAQEIYLELESIREDYLEALEGILAVEPTGSTAAVTQGSAPADAETTGSSTESSPDLGVESESEPVEESATGTTAEEPATEGTAEEPATEGTTTESTTCDAR